MGKSLLPASHIVKQLQEVLPELNGDSIIPQSTQPFEIYLTISPTMPKHAVVSAANAIARWVNKEEAKLFLHDAPVF